MELKNKWKKFKAWLNQPMPEHTCSECGETYVHFGPDGPRHKCSVKAQVKIALRELEEEKFRPTRKDYDKRNLPTFCFIADNTVDGNVLYVVGDEYDVYNWSFDKLVNLLEMGVLKKK